ncbi:glucokinase [Lysobacter sp. A378]
MTPSPATLALVADVGGTNSRFALTDTADPRPGLLQPRKLANAGFPSLQRAAEHYLDEVGVRPARAAIAVASPLVADVIQLTNRAWSFSRAGLQQALGLHELRLINDFAAVAWSLTVLQADDWTALSGPDANGLRGPVSVLGPGTGLGVGQLVGCPTGGWHVVATEGGHATFAPVDEPEHAIAAWLGRKFGRVSNERLLSGSGLAYIDAVLRGAGPPGADEGVVLRAPAEITRAAMERQEPTAVRALNRFCAILGSVAGDMALIHGARSVAIGGGIAPRFIPFLRDSPFRERFLDKGRLTARLESVPVHVVTHPNPGLLGAAVALRAAGA